MLRHRGAPNETARLCGGLDRSDCGDGLRPERGARLAVVTGPWDDLQALDGCGLSQRQLRLLPSHCDVDDLPTVLALDIQLDSPLQPPGRLVLPLRTGLPINLRLRRPRNLKHVVGRVKHETHLTLLRSVSNPTIGFIPTIPPARHTVNRYR